MSVQLGKCTITVYSKICTWFPIGLNTVHLNLVHVSIICQIQQGVLSFGQCILTICHTSSTAKGIRCLCSICIPILFNSTARVYSAYLIMLVYFINPVHCVDRRSYIHITSSTCTVFFLSVHQYICTEVVGQCTETKGDSQVLNTILQVI